MHGQVTDAHKEGDTTALEGSHSQFLQFSIHSNSLGGIVSCMPGELRICHLALACLCIAGPGSRLGPLIEGRWGRTRFCLCLRLCGLFLLGCGAPSALLAGSCAIACLGAILLPRG